jgi:hypothetical protein
MYRFNEDRLPKKLICKCNNNQNMPNDEETEILIKHALKELINRDLYLINKRLKEECINHRLAVHLEDGIKQFNLDLIIDIEYDKDIDEQKKKHSNGKPMRPDIIIHQRGNNINNFLAIEAKKGYVTEHDREKIKALLTQYKYTYVCLISYFPKKDYLKYIFLKRDSPGKCSISTRKWEKLEKRTP